MSREKFYITTAIDYVNAPPHIGHALEKVQADVIARYQRILGKEIYFLTGSDEHGAKVARAAEKAGKDVKEFVDENAQKFKELWTKLNISFDDFIRTSDEARHFPAAREIWKRINSNGDIYKKRYRGLYCVGHEAFITEKDLADGKCVEHASAPELLEEENYFFKLSKYAKPVQDLIVSGELIIIPEERKNEILAFIKGGVEDISVSRPSKDISWGIPVPGDSAQTMYVWFEALINYISALRFGSADSAKFSRFWPADIHIIGKDILRFHALMWPAMLISAQLPVPKKILVHGHIMAGGRKMSKTLGNVVDPFYYLEKYGADPLRHFILRAMPAFEDGDFTEEKFKEVYEGDLASGIGNFVSRLSRMGLQYFGGNIAKPDEVLLASAPLKARIIFPGEEEKAQDIELMSIGDFIENKTRKDYSKAMNGLKLNQALAAVFELLKTLDRYIDEYKPFKLFGEDKEKTRALLWNFCFGGLEAAKLLQPFLPETGEKMFQIFKFDEQNQSFQISEHEPLFPRK